MNTLILTFINLEYSGYFHTNQVFEPSLYPHLFVNDKQFERSRGAAWKTKSIDYQAGTITLEHLRFSVSIESPSKSVLLGQSKSFYDLVKKETDEALKKFYDDFADAAAYTLWNGMTVKADPSLKKDQAYIVKYKGDLPACAISEKQYKLAGGPKHVTVASDNYAKISFDAWEASEKASSELRPSMPTVKEMSDELLRELRRLQPGIEFDAKSRTGQALVVSINKDEDRAFMRSKVYGKATVSHGDIIDEVRGACFETCRLLAKLIKEQIDALVLNWHFEHRGIAIHFTGTPVVLVNSYGNKDLFAFFDHQSDAVCWRLCSYFFVTPVGEAGPIGE